MSKYFIDCGGWNGASVAVFRKLYDPKCEYKIFSFEPEPDFKNRYSKFKNHEFIQAAIWTYDDEITFYREKEGTKKLGGTLVKNKTSGNIDFNKYFKVKTVNLSQWIMDNFKKDDEILLKMDIEGIEYEVIPKMVKDKSIDYINKISVEWHYKKIEDMPDYIHKNVSNLIKDVPTFDWPRIPDELQTVLGPEAKNYLR
jgi:FkbM family methyltransferase